MQSREGVRIAFLGDIVGGAGRRAVLAQVAPLRDAGACCIIANAENASGGVGIAAKEARELLAGGVDVLTTGNHVWKHKDLVALLENEPRLLRPANYPPGTPGRGHAILPLPDGSPLLVVSLLGRTFLEPVDCPFRAIDAVLAAVAAARKTSATPPEGAVAAGFPSLVDLHAEATAEKHALRFHLDGRVSAVLGTHTHVQTSDAEVSDAGTAYVTDVGMCGAYPSVIGFDPNAVLARFRTQRPHRYKTAKTPGRVEGALLDIDPATGRCLAVAAIRVA